MNELDIYCKTCKKTMHHKILYKTSKMVMVCSKCSTENVPEIVKKRGKK